MATISPHLRNFKELTRDQLTELFFALPASSTHNPENADAPVVASSPSSSKEKSGGPSEAELEKMEINAVLSLGVQGEEDSYVSAFRSSAGSTFYGVQKEPERTAARLNAHCRLESMFACRMSDVGAE